MYMQAKSKLTRVHWCFLQSHLFLPRGATPVPHAHIHVQRLLSCSAEFSHHTEMLFPGQDHATWTSTFSTSTLPCRTPNTTLNTPRWGASIITPPTICTRRSSLFCLSHLNSRLKTAVKRSSLHDCNITINTLWEHDAKYILPRGLWAKNFDQPTLQEIICSLWTSLQQPHALSRHSN